MGRLILLKWIEETGLEGLHGTNLDPDRDKQCAFVHTVMHIGVP